MTLSTCSNSEPTSARLSQAKRSVATIPALLDLLKWRQVGYNRTVMIGLFLVLIVFIVVSIVEYIRRKRQERRLRDQPSVSENRQDLVKKHLTSQTIAPSVPDIETGRADLDDLSNDIRDGTAAADDENATQEPENIVIRTLNTAGNSLREIFGSSSISTTTTRRECTICLEHFKANETVSIPDSADCNHVFHQACITQWLENHDECPLCRVNLLQDCDSKAEPPR